MNSFPAADEAALERIAAPLKIEAHLAPEDPRRSDLERRALSKLRRVLPDLDVAYVSESVDRSLRAGARGLRRDSLFARRPDGDRAARPPSKACSRRSTTWPACAPASDEDEGFRGHPLAAEPDGAAAVVLCRLAGGSCRGRVGSCKEAVVKRSAVDGRDRTHGRGTGLMVAAAPQIKVDLSKERVGRAPATFEPMVGTWVVAQDGADKVVMVDGRPWVASKDNPTKLLVQSARKLYGTSNEELMDNAKQFAYYPVACCRASTTFSNGTISVKFKTVAGDADRASGILFNVKPNGDWLAIRYNDTENNVALWEFHNGIRRPIKFSDRAKPFMLDRAA